jgi:3-oxoacyl-[acyl-carrier protein] reductase
VGRHVALVTGSSRGLGAAIARRLARDGLGVAVNDRHGDPRALDVVDAIRAVGGVADAFAADVTDERQATDLVHAVAEGLGPAGGWGHIVQIDSEVVDRPSPGRSAYAAAKSAQIGLARAWARELAPSGITVNMVAPGFIPVERHADVPEEVRSAYVASVPAGHFGTPEELAAAVSFFASDAAGFVTGQRLVVDGGRGLG